MMTPAIPVAITRVVVVASTIYVAWTRVIAVTLTSSGYQAIGGGVIRLEPYGMN